MADAGLRKAQRKFIFRSVVVLLLIVVVLILPLLRFAPNFSSRYELALAKSGIVYRSFRFTEAVAEGIPSASKSMNGKYRYTVELNGKTVTLTEAVFDEARPASAFFVKNNNQTLYLAAVSSNGKWGYIVWDSLQKNTWRWLVEPVYDNAEPFCGGLAAICVDGLYGWIDHRASVLMSPRYDDIRYYSEGMIPVSKNGQWYYVDPEGMELLGPYEAAESFSEGYACVKQNGVWGYIDRYGTWVREPLYEDAWEVTDGYAYIKQNEAWHKIRVMP